MASTSPSSLSASQSLRIRLPSVGALIESALTPSPHSLPDLPPISALFVVDFDVKAGYTVAWRRALPGIRLDGLVEYKSLPSGLHTVAEDLIYFVHDDSDSSDGFDDRGDGPAAADVESGLGSQACAGLSAFVNTPCEDEEARHARMMAVGVLVPLSHGRLGRAWRHAEALRDMAAHLVKAQKNTAVLEQYWEKNQVRQISNPPENSIAPALPEAASSRPLLVAKGHGRRQRSRSDAAALFARGHGLSLYHPARSLSKLLDTFGPLIFPIHRAALLRRRILISCHAPVHEYCNFVYDISILSNVPLSVLDLLSPSAPSYRLRPLFTIGVHDMPLLLKDHEAAKRRANPADSGDAAVHDESGTGWIACTTDSILAVKDTLWDMLITMPPVHAANAKETVWPTVECPRGEPVKATQRDLRRYHALRAGLARHFSSSASSSPLSNPPVAPAAAADEGSTDPSSMRFPGPALDDFDHGCDRGQPDDVFDSITEPLTWASLAYSGFMWWASAGEQMYDDEQEEACRDASLLADLGPSATTTPRSAGPMGDSVASLDVEGEASRELAIIAYFHRLTSQMLTALAGAAEDNSTAEDYDSDVEDYLATDPDADERDRLLQPGGGNDRGSDDGDNDDDDDDDDDDVPVTISRRLFSDMGLDVWSARDAEFIRTLLRIYFGRESRMKGKGIEVCGVRVC